MVISCIVHILSFSFFLQLQIALSSHPSSSYGPRDLYVGDEQGWVKNPMEDYSTWAARNVFHINDELVFKYKKKKDSVLMVTREAYESCNTKGAMRKMASGDSWVRLDRLGPFFFISGKRGHCKKGQKLMVVVTTEEGRPLPHLPPCAYTPAYPWLCSPAPRLLLSNSKLWSVLVSVGVVFMVS